MSFVADEIAKLADLRNSGVLTAEEFEGQKARLLAADEKKPLRPEMGPPPPPSTKVGENLRKHSTFHTVKCLECGYNGRMGVIRTEIQWFGSWPFIILGFMLLGFSALIFPISGFVSIVLGIGLATLRARGKIVHTVCPNCERHLQATSG